MNHSEEDIITKDMEDLILEKTLKSFYQTNFHSSLQLESFNHFVNYKLPQIMEDESVIKMSIENSNYRIVFSNVFLEKPQIVDDDYRRRNLLPLEARIRDLTYAGNLVANINTCKVSIDETTGEEIISEYICHAKKVICKIPIMLFSSKCHLCIDTTTVEERVSKGECRYDHGGYFLIKGRERVLVTQERLNYNTIYCFEHKLGKYNTISEIRSMSEQTRHSTYIQMKMCRRNIVITLPYINIDVSIGVVFQAFGFSKKEIESLFLLHLDSSYLSYLDLILLDMIKIRNQESAIRFLSEHSTSIVKLENRSHFVEQLLHNEIFPHLGLISSKYCKGIFLMKMIKKVILTKENKIRYDRKDNISCKRFEIAGTLIGDLFRTLFKRFSRGIVKQIDKKIDENSIHIILSKINTIQNGLYSSFATGNWGIVKSTFIRMGVSQILSRFTNASMKSHLRRVITPVGKEGKNVKIRQLDSSTFGFLDPIETPEGQATGITKNMTTFVKSSLHYNSTHIKSIIETMRDVQTDFCYLVNHDQKKDDSKPTFIYLNGNLIGYTFKSDFVFQKMKDLKTKKILKEDISISREKGSGEIIIFSDDGRLLRPLFQTNKKPTMKDIHEKTFDILVEEGFIQYLDCYELENSLVAMNYDEGLEKGADYFEIHPTFMNACTTNLIPFPDHTQSPRNCYWSSMSKQALSKYCSNISNRVDTINYSLSYPEAPILDTHHSINDENQNTPFGSNLIVAIACFTGFNQEDSVIINKSAIDRGLLRAFSYRILTCEERKKNTISCEKIQEIPAILQNPSFDYSKLDKNGIIKVGSFVSIGTVLVGKIKRNNVKKTTNKEDILQCASIICKSGEEGYVDKIIITSNSEGYRLVKLKIRNEKIPEIGDKVCSRNAQKGTISIILNEEDLPYSQSDGIIPDLILNPAAIPSRMTLNQLIESQLGKYSLKIVSPFYATPFSKHSKNIISRMSKQKEFRNSGSDVLISGITGEKIGCVFIGCTFYQRLKHLVGLKIHARDHGKLNAMTRQPLEGRSRFGGLRFGEMERDCIISHGSCRFLRERLFEVSDFFFLTVCDHCGRTPTGDRCTFCNTSEISRVPLPFAAKLLFHNLGALGMRIQIFPKTKPQKKNEDRLRVLHKETLRQKKKVIK